MRPSHLWIFIFIIFLAHSAEEIPKDVTLTPTKEEVLSPSEAKYRKTMLALKQSVIEQAEPQKAASVSATQAAEEAFTKNDFPAALKSSMDAYEYLIDAQEQIPNLLKDFPEDKDLMKLSEDLKITSLFRIISLTELLEDKPTLTSDELTQFLKKLEITDSERAPQITKLIDLIATNAKEMFSDAQQSALKEIQEKINLLNKKKPAEAKPKTEATAAKAGTPPTPTKTEIPTAPKAATSTTPIAPKTETKAPPKS